MPLSFLSPQDVESWLPEPMPSNGDGFVAKLFTTINAAMTSLTTMPLVTNADGGHQRCRNELERFFLWGQGLSIVEGDLDEVLAHSKELHFRVLTLLLRLGTLILSSLSRDPNPPSEVLIDYLRTLLDTTESILQESDSEPIGPDTLSDSDASEYEVEDILDDIMTYIDCLLDLAPSLDNPALDIQVESFDEPSTQDKESFAASSEEALIYCRRIRDRFRFLPKYLVERLAEANVLRAAALRSLQSPPPKHDLEMTNDITESLFSTMDHRVTDTTKSTVPSSSVFSSLMEAPIRQSMSLFSDNASDTAFASFSTTQSTINQGCPRVPPIPELEGNGFNCPLCLLYVVDANSRKAWKKHVFDDLKPYVCTIECCEEPLILYDHSAMWAQHEASHPVSPLRSSQCPFCDAIYQHGAPAYFKHVSAHLREVSLSVLPQPTDEDDGFDSDDSTSVSPAPSQVQIGAQRLRFGGRTSGTHLAKRSNDVRRARACFRCHTFRIPCSIGGICNACKETENTLRIFPFGCDRYLSDRWVLMLPDVLTYHLGREQVQSLLDQSVHRFLGEGFDLPLTFGFEPDIIFGGRWYEPKEDELSLGVRIDDRGKSHLIRGDTPPITPYWVATGDVKRKVNSWLEGIIDSRLEDWVDYFFAGDEETLQSELIKIVCRFYYRISRHSASMESARTPSRDLVLKKALKLLVLEEIMSHQICIPNHAKDALQRAFPDRYTFSSDPTSPRLVNRVVKSILVSMMRYLAKEVMEEMEDIWRTRGHGAWTECVCIMIVLLTAGASVQVSLVDWSRVAMERDKSADVSVIHPELKNMEVEFCKHFIHLFHARFKTSNSRSPFNPFMSRPGVETLGSGTRSVVEGILSALQKHMPFPNGVPELNDVELDELGKHNIPRLLSYFFKLFFHDGSGGDTTWPTAW